MKFKAPRLRYRRRGVAVLLEAQMSLKKSLVLVVVTGAAITVPLLLPLPASFRPAPTLLADSMKCDLAQYKAASGLTAAMEQDVLAVTWNGQSGTEMRRATRLTAASR